MNYAKTPKMATSPIRAWRDLIAIGFVMTGLMGAISLFSPHVAYNTPAKMEPSLLFVGLAIISGVGLFLAPKRIRLTQYSSRQRVRITLGLIIFLGIIMRLIQFGSVPIFEDDWNRYLWEGAVSAHGVSPYHHPPADGFTTDVLGQPLNATDNPDIATLRHLSQNNNLYAYEVAYPYLSTIYPAGAQLAFQASYALKPFNLNAWRSILMGSDLLTLGLLLITLRAFARSPLWIALYWWNPVVILPGFNGAHMDILLGAPMLAAVLMARQNRPGLAGSALGLAVSIKIWPIILAPLVLRRFIDGPLSLSKIGENAPALLRAVLPIILISAISLFPLARTMFFDDSGLGNYTQSWQKNSLLFTLLVDSLTLFLHNPGLIARIIVAVTVMATVFILSWYKQQELTLVNSMLVVSTLLVLLAPAGYPWYAIWFAFLLPFVPAPGLIVLCGSFFLYYIRFAFAALDQTEYFNSVIVRIEFGLPIIWLVGWMINNRRTWR